MVRTVNYPEVLTPCWFVCLQMYPFLFVIVMLSDVVCVPVVSVFVKWCVPSGEKGCVGVVCVSWLVAFLFWKFFVSVCVMCAGGPWYERCFSMLSDMVLGAWLWTKLECFIFLQNIDISILNCFSFFQNINTLNTPYKVLWL